LSDFHFIGEVPDSAAIGRGQANTSVYGSPFCVFWNPAGIVGLYKSGMGISLNIHSETDLESAVVKKSYPLEGRKLNCISICGEQVGFYWRSLSNRVDESTSVVSGLDQSIVLDEKINVFGFSVAVPHSKKTDFGMNINFFSGIIGYSITKGGVATVVISDGYGWGLDWGLIYKISEGLNAGVTVMNFPAYIYWEDYEKDELPVIFRAGVDLRMTQLMAFGMDYENGIYDDTVDDKDIVHLGIEHYIKGGVIGRIGIYGNDFDNKYDIVYTAGLGYILKGYNIDLAVKQYYSKESGAARIRRYSISGVIPF
jgi:hypothetical protein